ncbi:MAG: tetratricopeptide repeat protein [Calditrichia bacterium]
MFSKHIRYFALSYISCLFLIFSCGQIEETTAEIPVSLQNSYETGLASALSGHFVRAEKAFLQAVQTDSNNIPSQTSLQITQAVLEKQISEKAGLHLFRAIQHGNEGNLPAKLAEQDSAIIEGPTFALAYNNRGITYYDLGRFGESISDRDKAIELREDYYEAYFNKALACEKLERFDEALLAFRGFVEYAPVNLDMHIAYAQSRISALEVPVEKE